MKLKVFTWSILVVFFVIFPVAAQENPSPVIGSTNIRQLQSVAHINFANLPEEVGTINNGWFVLNDSGTFIAVKNIRDLLVLLNGEGNFFDSFSVDGQDHLPSGLLDADFGTVIRRTEPHELLISLHTDGAKYLISYYDLSSKSFEIDSRDLPGFTPLRIWLSSTNPYLTFLELLSSSPDFPSLIQGSPSVLPGDGAMGDVGLVNGTPENDLNSFLRIGRIDPPLAITATKDALLKRWNLETGEVTATAQLDGLPAAGQVNADGNDFAWVDQKFEALHLLNFETGSDQVIAPLGGTYIPFLLLSAKADVIIGVNVGLEPDVVAWDVVTGEQIDLGEYRTCNRQPDMVRLSKDGSTLVVGCDTGLDIWRIPETP